MMMTGMLRALAKGPSHIISYSAVFGISQTLGGLAGSALLGTLQVVRQRFHLNNLLTAMPGGDALAATRLDQLSLTYARVVIDPSARAAAGATLLNQQVGREAQVLAFNDVFLLIGALAALAFALVGMHWLVLRARGVNPLAAELQALAKMRSRNDG
jgi:hypothetical protein